MGFHMAGNVRMKMDSVGTLHVFDVDEDTCTRFVDKFGHFGPIKIATSAMDVAQHSMTLISMVPMDEHARTVCLHPETGVIAATASPERLVLDCSTVSVTAALDIGRKLAEARAGTYIDAPVSGGVTGAEQGTLSFFCGSSGAIESNSIVRRLRDTLVWMGASQRINFCGHLGSGLTAKLVNNYIALGNLAVAAQGMAFGMRRGLDAKILYQCVKGSTGDSLIWNAMQPAPGIVSGTASSNSFKAGFSSRLGLKDMGLAIRAAEETGIDPTMGRTAGKLYEEADHDPRTTVSLSWPQLSLTSIKFVRYFSLHQGLDCASIWLHINDEVASFANAKAKR